MKRNTRLPGAARTGLAAIGLVLVTSVWSHFAVAQDAPLTETDRKRAEQKKPDYSPYPDQHFPTRVASSGATPITIPVSRSIAA